MIKDIIKNLKPSSTLLINEKSNRLEKEGKEIFKFGFGQSPFKVPQNIVDELKNGEKTWEELNLELAKKHTNSLRSLETDLNYLSEEAKSSLEKFKKLEKHQEEEFEVYLDKFVNDI